jgi:UDP-galactopyranose mutase
MDNRLVGANYDDNYFSHQFQGMPKHGYTAVINKILESNNIQIFLNQKFDKSDRNNFDYTFYSGPIDQWFNYSFGKLAYRTLDFETPPPSKTNGLLASFKSLCKFFF